MWRILNGYSSCYQSGKPTHYERVVHGHTDLRADWLGWSSVADTWSLQTASGSARNACAGSCGASMLRPAGTLHGPGTQSARFRRDR